MTERRILYVYEPSLKMYMLVMVILGAILADRFILSKNDKRVQHAVAIPEDAPKSTLSVSGKEHTVILSLAVRDIAVLTVEVSKLEHFGGARAMYYLLSPATVHDVIIISPHTEISKQLHLSSHRRRSGMLEYRRMGFHGPQGHPLQVSVSPSWSHALPPERQETGHLFRGSPNGGYGILFTSEYPDYTIFLLNVTKMRVFGQPTLMFYKWLEYYLKHRPNSHMLEIELLTHVYDGTRAGDLTSAYVVFTTGKCVDLPNYALSCVDMAGARCSNC